MLPLCAAGGVHELLSTTLRCGRVELFTNTSQAAALVLVVTSDEDEGKQKPHDILRLPALLRRLRIDLPSRSASAGAESAAPLQRGV